ncbi:MAG: ABC transporter permease subunit [Pyrinomonadaceae bacterium]|jgi:ABC-type dipeptide/oligopeptide/nickel transport system permease subunit|nr:ABC transporter permease subunit [Pyrinomonadaceae bacterium]
MNVLETFWKREAKLQVYPTEHLWAKLWANSSAKIGLIIGALLIIFVVVYPTISPYSPNEQISGAKLLSPTLSHPFGTDQFGRDLLTRIAAGGLRSLGSAVLALIVILFISISFGTILGMLGGIIDSFAMWIIDIFLALPQIILALAIVGVLGVGFENLLIAIIISSVTFYTRLARSYVQISTQRKDVIVARLSGVGWTKIVIGHIFPQVFGQMLIVATLDLGGIIISLASLSFLGLGVQPPNAEWGAMLAESRSFFTFAPWLLIAPALAIFLSVMSANLIGNALRDVTE